MCPCINRDLELSKLGVLGYSLEFPVGPKKLKFTEHARDELIGVLGDLGRRTA